MNDLEYTYAVARIRALESSLFSGTEIERLLACSDEEQCLQLLSEKAGETQQVLWTLLPC